MINHSVQYV